jgi:DNA-directed RNA polymerase specialized sigma24 family protein
LAGGFAIITNLVDRALQGDATAQESLRVVVYELIRELATYHVGEERKGHTFQVTALANEIWMRLERMNMAPVLACRTTPATKAYIGAMIRSFFVNCARKRNTRAKAEQGHQRELVDLDIQLDLSTFAPGAEAVRPEVFVDALERLAEFDARAAHAIELHVFGGLTWPQIAEMMQCALRTATLAYKRARLFLAREIRRSIQP